MSAPDIAESDIQGVTEVLRSGCLSLGSKTPEFETRIAEYVGAKYAVAVSSGTCALHLIVRALGIGKGDEVLVPSFTFAASANAILYEGGVPVFVDIEPQTFTMDPHALRRKINSRTKAIMVVDVFGHPAQWDEILSIAEQHGLKVIDDSCEALGAEYHGRKIGTFGDASAFGFYPNKQITTGEGGMVVTNDGAVAEAIRSMRNQGRAAMGAWLEHQMLGYNYRMSELSASLGITQLARIETFLEKRKRVASLYNELLSGVNSVRIQVVKPDVRMSWFVYVIRLNDGISRDRVITSMKERGIPTRGYFSPLHLQPYLNPAQDARDDLPVTERVASQTIALPFHNNLSRDDVGTVVQALKESLRESE